MLTGVQRRITKQGKPWASATLEDLAGAVEALFFPNTYELVGQFIAEDAIVVVKGRIDRRDETPRLMAMDLAVPDITVADAGRPLVVSMHVNRCTPPVVDRLKEILQTHPGTSEVHIKLLNGPKTTVLRLGPWKVTNDTALKGDLKALLGPQSLA